MIDAHYAREQGYQRRPVADTLIFSLVVGMSVADTSGKAIANLGFERVVFESRSLSLAIPCTPKARCSRSASRAASRTAA